MQLEYVCYGLLCFTLVREIMYMISMHKMVNKLMCRNLHEYNLANAVYERKQPTQEAYDESDREDLGSLQGLI